MALTFFSALSQVQPTSNVCTDLRSPGIYADDVSIDIMQHNSCLLSIVGLMKVDYDTVVICLSSLR